eukprot:5931758-Prymnesium_polylepis.2
MCLNATIERTVFPRLRRALLRHVFAQLVAVHGGARVSGSQARRRSQFGLVGDHGRVPPDCRAAAIPGDYEREERLQKPDAGRKDEDRRAWEPPSGAACGERATADCDCRPIEFGYPPACRPAVVNFDERRVERDERDGGVWYRHAELEIQHREKWCRERAASQSEGGSAHRLR